MKKTLVIAAMLAAALLPAAPAGAADMPAAKSAEVPAICFFLPLLPDCIEAWKAHTAEEKAKWEAAMKK